MRAIKNLFFIKSDIGQEEKYKFKNGLEIFLSKPMMGEANKMNFSPYERAVQVGEIAVCPMKIEGFKCTTELKKGDRVLLHHFVVHEDNQQIVDGELYYRANYSQIFAVIRDEVLIPLHDYIFCVPVFEDESAMKTKSGLFLKSTPDKLKLTAKIVFTYSGAGEDYDIYPGDVIKFMKDSDYEIKLGDTTYYRMNASRVLAKVESV